MSLRVAEDVVVFFTDPVTLAPAAPLPPLAWPLLVAAPLPPPPPSSVKV
jgi:hypothetical protein